MDKPAESDYPIHDLIQARWSPRSFLDRPVETGKLRSALEAARWASSCFNEQPWTFILAEKGDAEDFCTMVECLKPGNQAWAQSAGALLLSVGRRTFTNNDRTNRHAFHDVGLATAQFVLQATSDGLSVHQMAGFDPDRARVAYLIPDGYDPVAVLAVGYRGDPGALPRDLRDRELAPRSRKPQDEFVFRGSWGTPA